MSFHFWVLQAAKALLADAFANTPHSLLRVV
jgi:hypothetical protein